ncbi:hypothetical protein JCM15764A_02090 [Geotalea toluenoxydans]
MFRQGNGGIARRRTDPLSISLPEEDRREDEYVAQARPPIDSARAEKSPFINTYRGERKRRPYF